MRGRVPAQENAKFLTLQAPSLAVAASHPNAPRPKAFVEKEAKHVFTEANVTLPLQRRPVDADPLILPLRHLSAAAAREESRRAPARAARRMRTSGVDSRSP